MLPWVSISVPPKYEVWSLKYFRGSPHSGQDYQCGFRVDCRVISIYDHVSINPLSRLIVRDHSGIPWQTQLWPWCLSLHAHFPLDLVS